MHNFLIQAKQEVEKHIEYGLLPLDILLQIERTYSGILADGFAYHTSLPPLPKGKRGKQKQRDGKNILDRLKEKRDCVLLFIYDFSVDFTNNQGERHLDGKTEAKNRGLLPRIPWRRGFFQSSQLHFSGSQTRLEYLGFIRRCNSGESSSIDDR